MAKNTKPQSKQLTWTDVKAKLADFDRAALLDLIRSLYSANKDNQVFLHSRFGLGGDVLEPYKKIIDRWLSPDVLRNQDVSVSQAKQAISDYKKAVGDPEGVAELMVSTASKRLGSATTFATMMRDTSMPWHACSNRPSSPRTNYRPTARMTWSPG
jgi:hypothetical protein